MLYNAQSKQVKLDRNAVDSQRVAVTEKLEPLPHKGNRFFRLEERAHVTLERKE